jgi:hypothetical protein
MILVLSELCDLHTYIEQALRAEHRVTASRVRACP